MDTRVVIKRDGAETGFDPQRIQLAIEQAAKDVNIQTYAPAREIAEHIDTVVLKETQKICISDIQMIVENSLMAVDPSVARAYIMYRHDRDVLRERNHSVLTEQLRGLSEQSNIDLLNENANKPSTQLHASRDLLAGIVSKHYAMRHMLPTDVANAHEKGHLHYHDLDYSPYAPMFNCMIVDIGNMLTNGFKMGQAHHSKPNSIRVASTLSAQIIAAVASNIYGGTTVMNIDLVLEEFVTASYEKHLDFARSTDVNSNGFFIQNPENYAKIQTVKECYDAFQALEYMISSFSTTQGQTPFVSISFGLGTSWQSRTIQESILKVRLKGLGPKGETPIFPKLLFTIKEGLNRNPGEPNYDIKQLALKCAVRRMYPDILNYDKVVECTGSFKAPMGCRSFLGVYLDDKGVEVHEGRNNLGVVSINLPNAAMAADGDEEKFYRILDERLLLIKKALILRIERFRGVKAKIAPILYTQGACGIRLDDEDDVIQLFEGGRASISLGYIGVHETINALYASGHVFDSAYLRGKAIDIVSYLRKTVDAWKKETGWGFSLYSTPAENLCSRFCKLDVKEFGIVEGVTDKGYYTNSFHLDVEKNVTPYDKIDFEQPYFDIAVGGAISFAEFPSMIHNVAGLEHAWDYSYSRVFYYGTNTPIDECYSCGFEGEFTATSKGFKCPCCGTTEPSLISVTRRVCGYLGQPVQAGRGFNEGKQVEVSRRVKHS